MNSLNPKLFDKDVERIPSRDGFGEGLVLAGEENKDVVAICADVTESARVQAFKDKFPERFIEAGVAEQNMAALASGMAAEGKIPFMTSYAVFSPGRNWEQIRTTICYNNRPVKIIGSHAGISVGPDGATHQAFEDIGIMRVLPRMVVLSPCDSIEARKATIAAAKTNTPAYIRLARAKTPIITTEETPFEIWKAQVFYKSNNPRVGIIAAGALVHKAILAARELEKDGIAATVLNLATIKPLDTEAILALAKECGALVTVEEHQVAGGMGSAIAEFLSENTPTPIAFIGVRDRFGQSGTPDELLEHYGMGVSHIKAAAVRILSARSSYIFP